MNDNMDNLLKKALFPYIEPGDNLNGKIYEANRSGKVVKMRHHGRMIKTAVMADDNNMVIQIEAVPKKPEQYMLIDAGEADTVINNLKKQPLYIEISGNSEHGYSGDFFSESDGSLVYVLFDDEGTYSEGETLIFNAGYSREVPARSGFTSFELEYKITSLTKAEKIIYEPQEDMTWLKNVLNAQINEVCVYKSETSVKVSIDTLHEQTSGIREKGFDVWYKIMNEDGNELVSITGGTGEYIGDGIYRTRDVYEYAEMSDTLTIVAVNPLDDSEYGRFTVKRRSY